VNVVADYRSNQLIIQASARDMDEVRRLIERIDVETSGATNELRIFRLKNALASDVAPVLQDALNWQLIGNRTPVGATTTGFGAGIGQTEERARIRSAILTFMTVDSEGGKLLESGLLSEVRVTADVGGNALLVTGPSKSMGLIAALIKELDNLPTARAQIKVFTIVNGDATSLSTMLQTLLGQTRTNRAAIRRGHRSMPFLTPSLQTAASESTLLPVRFGVDQRTNSIIATGSEGDLGVVEAILLRLDEHSLRKQQTVVYWLANAPATDVATAVNNWLSQRTQLFQQQVQISPESPTIRINREIIVVAETISNSIIISAAPDLIEEIKRVVESLDRRPPLVKIDVLIAEVALTDYFEFGAEYGIQDGLLFDRAAAGYNFNNQPLGNTGPAGSNVLGQGLSTFGVGRISGERGYGGMVLSASSSSVSVLIRALQERGRLQILSRPTIATLDSQPASINVGATVSRLAGTFPQPTTFRNRTSSMFPRESSWG
jgi:general secretion pathway protein D